MIDTHQLNADPAAEAVRELDSIAELEETLEHERQHPRHDGGRSTVVNAIEERIGELTTEVPTQAPTETTRQPRKGGLYRGDELIARTQPRPARKEGED